ncbi:uncharacterized protein [Henckelia pumila]|uniref:uncharacterized protein n=1 Tax=Henckelia pumila TaxID=405737 RepID=UPI003C6DC467
MVDKFELIRKRVKIAHDRRNSYVNTKRRPLHFETGEPVFLRVSPFWKMMSIHNLFHVSLLCQYVADESHILHPSEVQLEPDLSYVERALIILDRKDKVLRNKRISLVMVRW